MQGHLSKEVLDECVLVLKRFTKNYEWFNRNFNSLERYTGRYVAVDDERVIGVAATRADLLQRFSDRKGVFIELITPSNLIWQLNSSLKS